MVRLPRALLKRLVNARRVHPKNVAVYSANARTIDFIKETTCRQIAEIGVYKGHTSIEFARYLDNEGHLSLFDFEDVVHDVEVEIRAQGYRNVTSYGSSHRYLDSYNWPLLGLLRDHPEPIYDYVFLDGAHTWAFDGFAFLLLDRLLMPGGYMDFDDYNWSLGQSPSVNPNVFPLTRKLYTDEQIEARQVKSIVDILVKRDSRYREVVENKIYQKVGATN